MSHASHHGPGGASDALGGHEEHHFDGMPADEPSPDEPRTPGWLTLLGVGLVLSVLLALALRGPEEKTRAELAAGAASAAPSAAPAASANPERPRPMRPAPAAGNPPGLPSGFPRLGMSGFRPMPRPPGAAAPGATAPGAAPMRPPPGPPKAPAP
jgi:hypothetical protein